MSQDWRKGDATRLSYRDHRDHFEALNEFLFRFLFTALSKSGKRFPTFVIMTLLTVRDMQLD